MSPSEAATRKFAMTAIGVKSSVLRGVRKALEAEALLETIRPHLLTDTRMMLDDPPPPSTWISMSVIEDIALATVTETSLKRWREVSHRTARDAVIPIVRASVEGAMRLFGGTPAILLSRMHQLAASTMRGLRYQYVVVSDHSGELLLTWEGCRDVPAAIMHGAAGGIDVVFGLSGVKGSLSEPEVVPCEAHNCARYRVSW